MRLQRIITDGMEQPLSNNIPEKTVYVTSDLHLDHRNIIRYCNRPFKTVREMNHTLVANWNNIISPNDTVFFLGDMTLGNSDEIIRELNGEIFFVKGNHDKTADPDSMHDLLRVSYKGHEFLFVHDPSDAPLDFDGWIIHGHHHNNHPKIYPFFNPEMRRINVSTELTKYMPVSMDSICKMISTQRRKIISLC